jgi:predicted MFS family arabinose efflux permease
MLVQSQSETMSDNRILIPLMLLQIIPYGFGCSTFFILAPEMKLTFGWSYSQLGYITAMNNIALLVMSYTAIWSTLFWGPRRAMTVSLLFSTTLFFILYLNNSSMLAICLVIALIAAAAIAWIPIVPFISMSMAPEKRGRALSVVCSGPPIAMVLVSFFAPHVIEHYGWNYVWGIVGVISVLIIAVGLPLLYQIPLAHHETVKTYEKIPLGLTMMCCAMAFANGMGDMPALTFMGAILKDSAGFTMAEAGRGWLLCGIGGVLSGPFLGRVFDNFGSARKTLLYVMPALAVTTALFVVTQNEYLLYLACFSMGLHHMAVYGIHGAYLSRTMGLTQSTKAFGLVSLSYGLGTVGGNYLVGVCRDVTGDFFMVFMGLCLMLGFATLFSYLLPEDGKKKWG